MAKKCTLTKNGERKLWAMRVAPLIFLVSGHNFGYPAFIVFFSFIRIIKRRRRFLFCWDGRSKFMHSVNLEFLTPHRLRLSVFNQILLLLFL